MATPATSTSGFVDRQEIWLSGFLAFPYSGVSQRQSSELMLELINNNTDVLPNHVLRIAWQDSRCSGERAREVLLSNLIRGEYEIFAPGVPLEQLNRDGVGQISLNDYLPFSQVWTSANLSGGSVGVLGDSCSVASMEINPVSDIANLPHISGGSTFAGLSDRSVFPNFWRTILPDTRCPPAWMALAKVLGLSRVTTVIGETKTWMSVAESVVLASHEKEVALDGLPLDNLASGFSGYQVDADSAFMAAQAAEGLKLHRNRASIILLGREAARTLLCKVHKLGLDNFVFMFLGWLGEGWWTVDDTDCSQADVTHMAWGLIAADKFYWREDLTTALSCAQGLTASEFRTEWLAAHERSTEQGYVPNLEGIPTADAVCMWALALHAMLQVHNFTVAEMQRRTAGAFHKFQEVFALTDFQGLSGNIRFRPGAGDPEGAILLQHLPAFTDRLVNIASYGTDSVLLFMGESNLTFKLPGETFFAGPRGGSDLAARPADFLRCEGGNTTLSFASNTCEQCPFSQVFVSSVQRCTCQPGFLEANGTCSDCPPGRFASRVGSTSCSLCSAGRFANASRRTSCARCEAGSFQDEEGQMVCKACPSSAPWTNQDASDSPDDCTCRPNQTTSANGSCQSCKRTFQPVVRGGIVVCECPPKHRFENGQCVLCNEAQLVCPGGYLSNQSEQESPDTTVFVKTGYMTLQSEPFAVLSCIGGEERCMGDRRVFSQDMCGANFDIGKASCSYCKEGYWLDRRNVCQPCGDASTALVLVQALCASLFQLGATFYLYKRFNRPSPAGLITLASVLTFIQALQSIGRLPISRPSPLDGFLAAFDIWQPRDLFQFLEFKFECWVGAGSELAIFREAIAPLLIFSNFVVLQCVYKLFRSSLEFDHVHNIIGLLFTKLFMTVVSLSLSLFYLVPMPSGRMMVAAFPDIEFASSEWYAILPLNVGCTVLYGVTTVAYVIWIVHTAPRRASSVPGFTAKYRFCFGAVRPDRWWWILAQLGFGLILNVTQVLLPAKNVFSKVYVTLICCVLLAVVQFNVWPFKFTDNNWVDLVFVMAVIANLLVFTAFIDTSVLDPQEFQDMQAALAAACVAVQSLSMLFAACKFAKWFFTLFDQVSAVNVEAAQIAFEFREVATAAIALSDKEFAAKIVGIGDHDRTTIRDATNKIINIIFHQQHSEAWLQSRLIPGHPFQVWDHSAGVVDNMRKIDSGHFAENLSRRNRLRRVLMQVSRSMQREALVRRAERTRARASRGISNARRMFVFAAGHGQDSQCIRQMASDLDVHQTTELTRETFGELMGGACGNLGLSQEDVDMIFDALDVDNSNDVTLEEFLAMMQAIAPDKVIAHTLPDEERVLSPAADDMCEGAQATDGGEDAAWPAVGADTWELALAISEGEDAASPQVTA